LEKEWSNSRDPNALDVLRAEYAERHGGQPTGPNAAQGRQPMNPAAPPPVRGWAIWLASVLVVLAVLVAGLAWMLMGVSLFAMLTVSTTLLTIIFLGPPIGGGLCVPGLLFSLLATRQARKTGARVGTSVTLVLLATIVLVGALLFVGLVAYPRNQLGSFAQQLQPHCQRVQTILQKYQNMSPTDLVTQLPAISATINQNQRDLQSDQTALNNLSAPDNPDAQGLLAACQKLVSDTLTLPTLVTNPNPLETASTLQDFYTASQDAQRYGNQLKQDLFAPFQPPDDLQF
jgi:hypothetical protein